MENYWVEVSPREPSADAGCSDGHSLACRASGGCCRLAPEKMAWKFFHPGAGKARKSLAKAT